MEDRSEKHLLLLAQLAREYQHKYRELEEICQDTRPEWLLQQLKFRAESTTDRFRAAQQALLAKISVSQGDDREAAYRAATALCRCFDEMRILFQVLAENTHKIED